MEIFLAEVDHLLAKEVAAPAGPAAVQVKASAGFSVNDRESPWVTLLTGTWRARPSQIRRDLGAFHGCLSVVVVVRLVVGNRMPLIFGKGSFRNVRTGVRRQLVFGLLHPLGSCPMVKAYCNPYTRDAYAYELRDRTRSYENLDGESYRYIYRQYYPGVEKNTNDACRGVVEPVKQQSAPDPF
jgi:hypothetical protein